MSKHLRHASQSSTSSSSQSEEITAASIQGRVSPAKYTQISPDTVARVSLPAMQCNLTPHAETVYFDTAEEFESHYTREHTSRCATCSKNFPTEHFLELHAEENHNPLREVLSERGERTYHCLVEGCDRKCSNPQKRRLHLIDKHMFPRNYNFQIINDGIDKATSMLREGRRRRVTTTSDNGRAYRSRPSTAQNRPTNLGERQAKSSLGKDPVIEQVRKEESKYCQADLDSLTDSMSALRFVPASVLQQSLRKGHAPGLVESDGKINSSTSH